MTESSDTSDAWQPASYARNARFVSEYGADLIGLLAPKPGERILDVGCGDGALTAQIKQRGAEVIGVDASPAMVKASRTRGIEALVARAELLPFEGGFDAIFSNAALHWVPEADAVLAGMVRALRPGGRVVVEQGGAGNVESVRLALIHELRESEGIETDLSHIWYFPVTHVHAARVAAVGLEIRLLAHFARPTSVADMEAWLHTLAAPVLSMLPAARRNQFAQRVVRRLAPQLRGEDGQWTVDYARLRYLAFASA